MDPGVQKRARMSKWFKVNSNNMLFYTYFLVSYLRPVTKEWLRPKTVLAP